jgi:hypothetical protein
VAQEVRIDLLRDLDLGRRLLENLLDAWMRRDE